MEPPSLPWSKLLAENSPNLIYVNWPGLLVGYAHAEQHLICMSVTHLHEHGQILPSLHQ